MVRFVGQVGNSQTVMMQGHLYSNLSCADVTYSLSLNVIFGHVLFPVGIDWFYACTILAGCHWCYALSGCCSLQS